MSFMQVKEHEIRLFPTYETAYKVMNGDEGSREEFIAWTILRSLIILPGLYIAGIRGEQLIIGSVLGSIGVSAVALYRMYNS